MLPKELTLPPALREWLENLPYTVETIGFSGSTVLLFDDMVLKIEACTPAAVRMVEVMRWLHGRLPVPEVLHHEVYQGRSILLMSRIRGQMACSKYYMEHSDEMVSLLAEGLRMLWAVDAAGCPRDRSLDNELADARRRVESGLVTMDGAQPETYGPDGFASPEKLLEWLESHRPAYDPVLSHGDYCLPNVFLADGCVTGMIDLGDTGIADRWRDIALCWRSLRRNFDGSYGGKVYPDFNPDLLLEKLGIPIDREKLRYYILLDELF